MPKSSSELSMKNYQQKKNKKFVQDLIGIKEIFAGLVFLDNGQCIDIIEILPINYDQKSDESKDIIIDTFISIQRTLPDMVHLKVRNETPSVGQLMNNLQKHSDNHLKKQVLDQTDLIKNLRNTFVKRKRYYIIHHYTGKSRNREEIIESMYEERYAIASSFNDVGHITASPDSESINELVVEMLYRHFNPKSSIEQSFKERMLRLLIDEEKYNHFNKEKRTFLDCDYVAPRGIRIVNSDALLMDGTYHTYLTMLDNSYPEEFAIPGYLSYYLSRITGLDYDIDVYSIRQNHAVTTSLLKQASKVNRSSANSKSATDPNAKDIAQKATAQEYMRDAMEKQDQDCFNCLTDITIRADSYPELLKLKRSVIKQLKQSSIYLEEAENNILEHFKMTMPFMYISKSIFNKNKRNFLSESMPAFYWYTTSELSDDSGVILGVNMYNNSIASTNLFNSNYHVNPHLAIIGTSGAGKTYLQQMIGRRFFFSGIKCMFIIPAKGYEYKDSCITLGGSYIKVGPGIHTCINIMEIRTTAIAQDESLLANKITTLTVFMQLLIKGDLDSFEISRFPVAIKSLYKKFGITDDNSSLYDEKGYKKTQPILSNLYDELKNDSKLDRLADALLPLIHGQYSNMNGQTNVDTTNDYIVFDAEERIIGNQLFPVFMFLIFDLCKDIGMYDRNNLSMIFIDEVWKMLTNSFCANEIKEMIKLLRGYGTGVCISTQDIIDYLKASGDIGKHLLSNSDTTILLKLKESELHEVSTVIELSNAEKSMLQSFKRGNLLYISDGNKIPIATASSCLEQYIYETIEEKRQILLDSTGLVLSDFLEPEIIELINQSKPIEDGD